MDLCGLVLSTVVALDVNYTVDEDFEVYIEHFGHKNVLNASIDFVHVLLYIHV